MEIQGEDGTKLLVLQHTPTHFGRSQASNTKDKTVSRNHIIFKQHHQNPTKSLSFEVVGKNPIWINRRNAEKVAVFKRAETGELMAGDSFCVNGRNPIWFSLKSVGHEEESDIDPVKEFGFLMKGHEFDNYPKKMIRDVQDWNWFLEEPSKDSDDDDDGHSARKNSSRSRRGKRKKGKGNDDNDDDWTGESEDDKEIVTKLRKVGRPKYSTRSKDRNKHTTGLKSSKGPSKKSSVRSDEENVADESEDEDTLGGFIVDDVDEELEEESNTDDEEEEEEEEFVDEDEDE